MIKYLLTTAAALALMTGAAHAQPAPPASAPMATPDVNPKPMDSTASATAAAMPAPMAPAATAPEASTNAAAVVSVSTVTNGPVADTPENRAKYGQPLSRAGKRTLPKGN